MKHMLTGWCLCAVLLAVVCTGCSLSNAAGGAADQQSDANAVSTADHSERSHIIRIPKTDADIESLILPGSQLTGQTNLRIIKFENGKFYGLGHGPSDGDCRLKSGFSFDFCRNYKENVEGSECFYSDAQEYPVGSGIFYYIQSDEAQGAARFMRINYNTFSEEVLLDPGDFTAEDIVAFYPSGQSVYYLDRRDNIIWQQSFSDGARIKIAECPADVSDVNDIYVYNNSVYVLQYDSCTKISMSDGAQAKEISGRILARYDHEIYYLDTRNTVCIYDAYTGDTVETGVLSLYSKPYCMGRWTAILSSPASTIYIWDTEQKKVVQEVRHRNIRRLAGAYENRYFLYAVSTDTLGVIDVKNQTDELIGIESFMAIAGDPVDRWFIDEKYLYAQDICDPACGSHRGDEFYRLSLNRLVPAGTAPSVSL